MPSFQHLNTPKLLGKELLHLASNKNLANNFKELYTYRLKNVKVNFQGIILRAIVSNNIEIVKYLHEHQLKKLDFIPYSMIYNLILHNYEVLVKYLLDAHDYTKIFEENTYNKILSLLNIIKNTNNCSLIIYIIDKYMKNYFIKEYDLIYKYFTTAWINKNDKLYDWIINNLDSANIRYLNFYSDKISNVFIENTKSLNYLFDKLLKNQQLHCHFYLPISNLINKKCVPVMYMPYISKFLDINYIESPKLCVDLCISIIKNKNTVPILFKFIVKKCIMLKLINDRENLLSLNIAESIGKYSIKYNLNEIKIIFNQLYNDEYIDICILTLSKVTKHNYQPEIFEYIYNRLESYYIKRDKIDEFFDIIIRYQSDYYIKRDKIEEFYELLLLYNKKVDNPITFSLVHRILKTNNNKLIISFIEFINNKCQNINEQLKKKYYQIFDDVLQCSFENYKITIINYILNKFPNISCNLYIGSLKTLSILQIDKEIEYNNKKYKYEDFLFENILGNLSVLKIKMMNYVSLLSDDKDDKKVDKISEQTDIYKNVTQLLNHFTHYNKYKPIFQKFIDNDIINIKQLLLPNNIQNLFSPSIQPINFINIMTLIFIDNSDKYDLNNYINQILNIIMTYRYSLIIYFNTKFDLFKYNLSIENKYQLIFQIFHTLSNHINGNILQINTNYNINFDLPVNTLSISPVNQESNYLLNSYLKNTKYINDNINDIFNLVLKYQNYDLLVILIKHNNLLDIHLLKSFNIMKAYRIYQKIELIYLYYIRKLITLKELNDLVYLKDITYFEYLGETYYNCDNNALKILIIKFMKLLSLENKNYYMKISDYKLIEYYLLDNILGLYKDKKYNEVLKKLEYKPIKKDDLKITEDICPICYDEIGEDISHLIVFDCNHYLCINCYMDSYYIKNKNKTIPFECMLCRGEQHYKNCRYSITK